MREANAAGILTVVLATAGLSACSGSIETGAGGHTTGTGGTGGDAGVYDAPGDGIVSDAVPAPLVCSDVKDGQMIGPSAALSGTTLTVDLPFTTFIEGAIGWHGTPSLMASQGLGTVDNVLVQGTTLTVTITTFAGSDGGQLFLSGDVDGWGPPPDYGQVACPVSRVFDVIIGDAGQPMISELTHAPAPAPGLPVDQRPRLTLTLLGSDGLTAKVRAAGVPEGATVELETTGGVALREGALVDWSLPPEPGLYQLELVVRRGSAIATSALAVEVKDTST